jgi:hypothetical protein
MRRLLIAATLGLGLLSLGGVASAYARPGDRTAHGIPHNVAPSPVRYGQDDRWPHHIRSHRHWHRPAPRRHQHWHGHQPQPHRYDYGWR